MFSIIQYRSEQKRYVAKVLESSPTSVTFGRSLVGPRQALWNDLFHRLDLVHSTHGSGIFRWNLIENGIFSVPSMYNALIQHDIPVDSNKKNWKMKIPLKTKVFAWYLRRGVILTEDNRVRCAHLTFQ
jgi:hypothetical protein